MKDKDKKYIIQFGRNLQELRKAKGYTQEDLSSMTDIPRTQLGRIERGEVNTTIHTMLRLSRALKVEVIDLFRFSEQVK